MPGFSERPRKTRSHEIEPLYLHIPPLAERYKARTGVQPIPMVSCTRRQIFRPSLIISCIAISISVPPSIFSLKVDFVPEHPSVYHPSIPSPVGWAVMAEAWMLGYGKDRFCLCVVACNASSAG